MSYSEPNTSPVNALADRFWEGILQLNPTTATVYGDERFDDRLEDPSPEGRARARAMYQGTLKEAEAIPTAGLSVEERITRDMMVVVCELHLEQDDQRIDILKVVDQMIGPQTLLPAIVQFQKADTRERFDRFVARLQAYPAFMKANSELVREGLETGLTAARIVAERTISQFERLLALPVDESPIVVGAQVASEADRTRLADVVRETVYPADAEFLAALRGDYFEATRQDPGLWSAPNGETLYRTQSRGWTTLELDPREVHETGLEELEVIERERREISRVMGFGDDTKAYRAALEREPSNIPKSAGELLDRAREDIERAAAAAPKFFGRLPRANCEVRAVEEYREADTPAAFYYPPNEDGSRSAIFFVNTYDLPSRLYSKLAMVTYHEAVPGHHFQIALEMEHLELPAFRRLGSRMLGSAYAEGWGLYSERLADDMDLYRGEDERFGMLDAQALRAARLVVDTGMHALKWSRQQSITFLREQGLSETDAAIETDRYIVWPGQALTYKVGQRAIEQLRRQIHERDGSRFDLREFHDQVLGHGSLPLATLARELPTWVATRA